MIHNFSISIKKALSDINYTSLTEIQQSAIPSILGGRDVIAQALTGSGKTAAFVIPIIENIITNKLENKLQVLILAPTRELVQQIDKQIKHISKYTNVKHIAIYGGANKHTQIERIKNGVNIITATPGRFTDLLVNENIDLSTIKTFVVDEVDRMLDIEMKTNIIDIVSFLPKEKQTLFFSATYPLETSIFAKKLLKNPIFLASKENIVTPEKIVFKTIKVGQKDKINKLIDLLQSNNDNKKNIIFTNTIHCANFLTKLLSSKDIPCINLHSQRSQHQREIAIETFSNEENFTLIATDIAARGIDIPNIDLVINFDEPKTQETHIHRAGRTARMNKTGTVITFISSK